MKLNLGCGPDYREGFINIDAHDQFKYDLICNVEKLPYEDNSTDYIIALDLLEHFTCQKTEQVLKEWIRVLKSGHEIQLRVPDFEAIIDGYNTKAISTSRAIELLFAKQTHPFDFL